MAKVNSYEIAIIGGGFYGCMIALFLKKFFKNIVVIEKESELLTRASYCNQARVHNGYHYPRSFVTALRSHINYQHFVKDFKDAVRSEYTMTYAIASHVSKTTSRQFLKFCHEIGSPVKEAPQQIKRFFNRSLIEEIFEVNEYVFDAGKIRKILARKLQEQKVDVMFSTSVKRVAAKSNMLECHLSNGKKIVAQQVINCTYAGINELLENSSLPLLPFKHEFIEMPLIQVPPELSSISMTMMDGPFFGFLHFPDRHCHSLWHVAYAVRANWTDMTPPDLESKFEKIKRKSNINFMLKDAQRYIPLLGRAKHVVSLFDVKTLLQKNEQNDGRPILFRKDYSIPNFHIIMGGKIDNIYDMFEEMQLQFNLH